MNGKIDEVSPVNLIEKLEEKLNIKLSGEQCIMLTREVLKPALQKEFDEGVQYAKRKMLYSIESELKVDSD